MGEVVQRAWGTYEVLTEGPRYKVKRLIMEPGKEFSYQLHFHRAEVWVVVSGTGYVRGVDGGGKEFERLLPEGHQFVIQQGARHKLSNRGKIPVVVIEVQYGSYLEEDDIVRLATGTLGPVGPQELGKDAG